MISNHLYTFQNIIDCQIDIYPNNSAGHSVITLVSNVAEHLNTLFYITVILP